MPEVFESIMDCSEIPLPDLIPVTASRTGDRSQILALAKSVKDRMTLFRGGSDPWLARSWLENVTDTFTYIICTEAEQVELAIFHLRDQAVTEAFEMEYFSEAFCMTQRQEFLKLKQGDCSVTEYHSEFTKHSEFCSLMMSSCIVTTYREALDRALVIETTQRQVTQERDAEKSKGQNSRSSSQKRPAQGFGTWDSSRLQKGKRPAGSSSGYQRKEISEKKCYRCGFDSHRMVDCPSDRVVCYYCKQPGHMMSDWPRRAQLERTGASASRGRSIKPRQ
ncbi:uncharacterized protein LOC141842861 [Curcuma longa]|uniref:uncharacterized protein LOC141842861 n=1 Tax=Curcuma longa TaxID=136217 RepID=UPI003D9DBA32